MGAELISTSDLRVLASSRLLLNHCDEWMRLEILLHDRAGLALSTETGPPDIDVYFKAGPTIASLPFSAFI